MLVNQSTSAVEVDFRESPLRIVAEYYAKLSNRPVVVPSNLRDVPITVSSVGTLAESNACVLIEEALQANGFQFVQGRQSATLAILSAPAVAVAVSPSLPFPPVVSVPSVVVPQEIEERGVPIDHARVIEVPAYVEALFSNRVTCVVDARQRRVVLRGSAAALAEADIALAMFDRELRQVVLEGVLVEVRDDNTVASGVNLMQRTAELAGAVAVAGTSQPMANGSPVDLLRLGAVPTGVGTVMGTIRDLNLHVLVRLSENDSRFNVISRPTLQIKDGESGSLHVGSSVPFVQSALSQMGSYSSSNGIGNVVASNVQYLDSGMQLQVTVRIGSDRIIDLDVVQSANEVAGTVALPTGQAPQLTKRTLQSKVQVRSGDTIVLGGLIRETESWTHVGIPWLGRVPGLGRLFSERTKQKARSELLVYLRPTVKEI